MMNVLTSTIFGGFISKVINDITDVSNIKNKILNAVKNRKNRYQNIETQIYNVIVDTLNKFIYNEYINCQDKIYEAAEVLFKEFKVGEDEAIRACLQKLNLDVNENEVQRFKVVLCKILGKIEYRELYCAILLLLLAKRTQFDYTLAGMLDEMLHKLDSKEIINEGECFKNKAKSRTQEYFDKWNENMFLNNFTEWDKKRGINIKLSDVYIKDHLPHFLYGDNPKVYDNIDALLSQHIMKNDDSNKMLLILGQPGIGKSTLITWILNNFKDRIDDILVYQFASDLKGVPWGDFGSGKLLIDELGLSYNNLNNKVLILDGFDEIDTKKGRKDILDKIYDDLIYKKNIKKFSLIITCRENYIDDFKRLKCKYILLQPWDAIQIKSFCDIYCKKNKSKIFTDSLENIINTKNVLGIPLILYMTLALNITVEKENSIVSIYDRIFSLDGGIYDRCIDNRNFAEQHRIGEIKRQIHQVSREIAFWIFENKPEEAYIPQKEYQKICDIVENESKEKCLKQDFIIGNFYRLKYCEGIDTNELYFIHRTIYEYFIVENIFSCMNEAIKISEEELASVFGYFFKEGRLSKTICEILKYKIQNSELRNKNNIIVDTFNLMLKDGMTYHTNKCYKDVIDYEMKVFINMLEFIHLWNDKDLKMNNLLFKYLNYNKYTNLNLRNITIKPKIYIDKNNNVNAINSTTSVAIYLKEAYMARIYLILANLDEANLTLASLDEANLMLTTLKGANLTLASLKGAILSMAKLKDANLTKAILDQADLSCADLSNAILKKATLVEANVQDINLTGADLTETIFDENQVSYLKDKYDLSKAYVCLKTGRIIKYKEYKEYSNGEG